MRQTYSYPSTKQPILWMGVSRLKSHLFLRMTHLIKSPAQRKDYLQSKKRSNDSRRSEGIVCSRWPIFAGIPVNVTLLFSREHYLAAAEAFLRGIERRIESGLNPNVGSVASVFVSRWDGAVKDKVSRGLRNKLGLAMASRTYKAARQLLSSPRWQRVYNLGARPQRLLWASTGTKDPQASDVLYVKGLAAPFTVNTMPEGKLKALATHEQMGPLIPADGGDCEEVLAQFRDAGIDIDELAAQLQVEGAGAFVRSWNELLAVISSKSEVMKESAAA